MLERWEAWLKQHRLAAGGSLVALALAVFGGSLANGFVADDVIQILQNPFIHNPESWRKIFSGSVWSFAGLSGDYYRPLQDFSWWFLYRLDGANYVLFHLFQLLLFAVTVALVFRLGLELLENDLAAFVGALLWVLHPQHVEPVVWISALGDVGVGLFYTLGFWLFLRAQKRATQRWAFHLLAALCFFTALLFKEMALSFPLILLAYWFFFPGKRSRLGRAAEFVPYALGLGAYLVIRHAAVGSLTLAGKPWDLTRKVLLGAVGLFGKNTQLFFWPVHLNAVRNFDLGASLRSPWPWAMILAALAALWFRKSHPKIAFLLFWWPLALAPCLDYRQLSWPLVSDRFTYLPSVGLCLLIAYLAAVWLPARVNAAAALRYGFPALGVVAFLWGYQSVRDVPHWRDNKTFTNYSARQAPDSPLVHMEEAWKLHYQDHNLAGAAREFHTALLLNERSFRPIFNLRYKVYIGLGHVALDEGRRQEAIQYFNQAITMWPQMTSAYHSMGSVYFSRGDYARAAQYFQTAVNLDHQDLIGRFYLGTCLMKLGRNPEAAAQFYAARQIDPTYVQAYVEEARALDAAGHPAAAQRVREEAARRTGGH